MKNIWKVLLVLGFVLVACNSEIVKPPPAKTLNINAQTLTLEGLALPGVSVKNVATGSSVTTNASGSALLEVGLGSAVTLEFKKSGFANQFKVVNIPAGSTNASVTATLIPRDAALPIADIALGGTVLGRDGASAAFPEGSLVNSSGAVVTGAVEVNVTPVNVLNQTDAFPGSFEGISGATTSSIVSFGTVEFVPTQNGEKLQVAPGKKVLIEIPMYADQNKDGSSIVLGQKIPLWSLNETTGVWLQEGEGTVVSNPNSPTGFALRAEVSHFTWWNCDDISGAEARINLTCNFLDAAGQPTVPLADGQTCQVKAFVPNSSRRPTTLSTETINKDGLLNVRIPANTPVQITGTTTGDFIGMVTVNFPESSTPKNVVIPLEPAIHLVLNAPIEGTGFATTGTASAAVTSGTPDKLELLIGGVKIAEDSVAPFEFSFSTSAIPEGFTNIQAQAIKKGVAVGITDARGISIDRSAPIISLSRLAASAGNGKVKMQAAVQDLSRVAKVEFFKGSQKLGEDSSFPFQFEYTLAVSDTPSLTFSAKAADAVGNAGTSNNLEVETIPPTISLVRNPNTDTFTSSVTVTYKATANDASGIARVEFFKGTQKLGEDSSAPFEQVYTVTGADEPSLVVTAKAIDNAGNTASISNTAPVNISSNDPIPPTVNLDAVVSPVTSISLELAATATDNVGIAKVEFYANGILQGETTTLVSGKYLKTINVGALNGSVTFTAKAFDAAGNTASSSQTATVQIPAIDLGGSVANRLTHNASCTPSLAVDSTGTPYAVVTSHAAAISTPRFVQVFRLIGNAWEKVGANLENPDSVEVSGAGICPVIALTSSDIPVVGFAEKIGAAGRFLLSIKRFVAGNWESIQGVDFQGGNFDLITDSNNGIIVARSQFLLLPAGTPFHVLERYDGATWTPLTNALATPFTSAINGFRLAKRPNGNIVIALIGPTDPFATGIFVKEWNGISLNSLAGQIDGVPDTSSGVRVFDLDVDDTHTYLTSIKFSGSSRTSFTRQYDTVSNTFSLVGNSSDQLNNDTATSMILNGKLLQVLVFAGISTKARTWNGSSWSTPVVLPIQAAAVDMVRTGSDPLLIYKFDTICCGPDGAILARLNLP
jgi:Bacterial Ig domain